ncbi:hypothetical protein [Armatimonas sp.]|uniref:hypothetical protein n=1 Tax=Armatimonas sp. TaxID=1872638 RepID=UPI00374D67A7
MQNGEKAQGIGEPPRQLAADQDWNFPPLKITSLESGPSALLQIEHEGKAFTFATEYKPNWQERAFQAALERATATQQEPGHYPLIVLPYLSEKHLDTLAKNRVSGLDLCGNGLILVPGHWLIRQSGKPNRFRIEQTLRNPYQGKASLVGRTLLQQGTFAKLDDLHAEIVRRGGEASLALVSRAVQRLEEDVVTLRTEGSRVRLVQPEKLLDALVQAYEPRRVRLVWRGKVPEPEKALPLLFARAKERGRCAIMTGIGSATRYAPLAMESTLRLYLSPESDVSSFLSELGAVPGERFPNLEIYAYPDETCFFDGKAGENGVVWASPLQTYLEMKRNGDIRLQESAAAIRPQILGEAHGSR